MAEVLKIWYNSVEQIDLLNGNTIVHEWLPNTMTYKDSNISIDSSLSDYKMYAGRVLANVEDEMKLYIYGDTQANVKTYYRALMNIVDKINRSWVENDPLQYLLEWTTDADTVSKYATIYNIIITSFGSIRSDTYNSGFRIPSGNKKGAVEITLNIQRSNWSTATTSVGTYGKCHDGFIGTLSQYKGPPVLSTGSSRYQMAREFFWYDDSAATYSTHYDQDDMDFTNASPWTVPKDVNDYWYIGQNEPFSSFSLWPDSAMTSAMLTSLWSYASLQYWNGATWATASSGFVLNANYTYDVYLPSSWTFTNIYAPLTGWAATTVDSSASLYFVRIKINNAVSMPTMNIKRAVLAGACPTIQIDNTGKGSLPSSLNLNLKVLWGGRQYYSQQSFYQKFHMAISTRNPAYFDPYLTAQPFTTWIQVSCPAGSIVNSEKHPSGKTFQPTTDNTILGRSNAEVAVRWIIDDGDGNVRNAYRGKYRVFLRIERLGTTLGDESHSIFLRYKTGASAYNPIISETKEYLLPNIGTGSNRNEIYDFGYLEIGNNLRTLTYETFTIELMQFCNTGAETNYTYDVLDLVLMPIDEIYLEANAPYMKAEQYLDGGSWATGVAPILAASKGTSEFNIYGQSIDNKKLNIHSLWLTTDPTWFIYTTFSDIEWKPVISKQFELPTAQIYTMWGFLMYFHAGKWYSDPLQKMEGIDIELYYRNVI